ncbi:MAG: efflux transporter outer membrane subunit [Verrucomicrobiales bacterium]|nr:efflux transporter outer membrane subunit [Verrucomicrobiales bacterium]
MNATTLISVILTAPLLLSGCAVGPDYHRPTVPQQARWKESVAPVSNTVLPPSWWRSFGDAELDALEDQAVAANQDLQVAMARVREARALHRASRADLYPMLSGSQAYTRSRLSENRANTLPGDLESDDFSASFDLSYELDLWGRVRRSAEASKGDAASVAWDLQTVLLTLTADVARTYCGLRSLDQEREVVEATIEIRADEVGLQTSRHRAGLIHEADLMRARTEHAASQAELQAILRVRAQMEHALAVLCGQSAGDFTVARRRAGLSTPEIPAGLPSTLLERRPDILAAEERLKAASARIGVAKAAFFPTVKITGTAGLASADLGTLFNWPSKVGSIGPSIHVPIFEGGKNRADLKGAEARYDQALAGYRAAILTAFREVEDALSDLTTLSAQSEAVGRALQSARDTASLANERYAQGLSSYLDVVDARRVALDAERQEAQLIGQRAVSTILLAKAMGGGWED